MWWWAATPMWTTPALAPPSSAVCWKPRATRSACWPSPVTPTARISSGSASRNTASSSAAAMWTAWSATIPWQKFLVPRMNIPPAARVGHARTAVLPCTPSWPRKLTPTCRSSWAVWKHPCGGLPTTITGWTPFCPASLKAPARTLSASAWASTRLWRSPAAWPPESRWSPSPMWTAPAT